MGFFDKLFGEKNVRKTEKGGIYLQFIDLFELPEYEKEMLQRLVESPVEYYKRNSINYESREVDEDADVDDIIWIGILDLLVENEILAELDPRADLDFFRFSMWLIDKDKTLDLKEDLFHPNAFVKEWFQVLETQLGEDRVIAGIEIDRRSYGVFLVERPLFLKMAELARALGRRMDLAKNL